jgi:hypothetical protein
MDAIVETFKEVDAAIGWTAAEWYKFVGRRRNTTNEGLVKQGFTVTRYVVVADGTQWTVHFNPKSRLYSGAHPSSGWP